MRSSVSAAATPPSASSASRRRASRASKPGSGRSVPIYRGEVVGADGPSARLTWLPADLPSVPVDVAAGGPATIALGATVADRLTFNLGADASLLGWGVSLARQAHERAGLDSGGIDLGAYVNVSCDPDRAAAVSMVRGSSLSSSGSWPRPWPTGCQWAARTGPLWKPWSTPTRRPRTAWPRASRPSPAPDAFLERFTLAGPAPELVDRLAGLSELGLRRIVVVPASRDADPSFVAEIPRASPTKSSPTSATESDARLRRCVIAPTCRTQRR